MKARENLGSELKRLRENKTLREVAAATGYDFTWLSKVENNRETPSWCAVKKLLAFYGVDDVRWFAYRHLMETKKEQFQTALTYLPAK